mmetsp:Transcript_5657/g.17255  ORF Transcript_5657/g.17255 Transcript_5657/m.17255 type:complete len:358 (+) Transcript_5657:1647-2720(+)
MALPTLGMRSAAGCTGPGRPRLWLRLALPLRPSDRLRLERADSWPSRFSDWSNADTRIEPEPRPGTPRAASSTRSLSPGVGGLVEAWTGDTDGRPGDSCIACIPPPPPLPPPPSPLNDDPPVSLPPREGSSCGCSCSRCCDCCRCGCWCWSICCDCCRCGCCWVRVEAATSAAAAAAAIAGATCAPMPDESVANVVSPLSLPRGRSDAANTSVPCELLGWATVGTAPGWKASCWCWCWCCCCSGSGGGCAPAGLGAPRGVAEGGRPALADASTSRFMSSMWVRSASRRKSACCCFSAGKRDSIVCRCSLSSSIIAAYSSSVRLPWEGSSPNDATRASSSPRTLPPNLRSASSSSDAL